MDFHSFFHRDFIGTFNLQDVEGLQRLGERKRNILSWSIQPTKTG